MLQYIDMSDFVSAFGGVFPEVSPRMRGALSDIADNPDGTRFAAVPLVDVAMRQTVMGHSTIRSALLACGDLETGTIALDSASNVGATAAELAELAYDLVEPLATRKMLADLGGMMIKTLQAGYRSLGGVMIVGDEARQSEFGLLIVPSINKFGVYDMLDLEAEENAELIGLSREEVSTNITANVLSWVIDNTKPSN